MVVTIFYLHYLSPPSLSFFLLYKQFCKIKPALLNWWSCTFGLLCTLIGAQDFNIHWIITPVGHTLPDTTQNTLGPSGHKGIFQVVVNLWSPKTPKSLSTELLPSPFLADSLFCRIVLFCRAGGTWGYSSPGTGPYTGPCWTSSGVSPPSSPVY